MRTSRLPTSARRQGGLTLIEFMVSIVLGMLMVAAIATLIASQSTNRAELDRSGKMIENGRYAIQNIVVDAQMAGYWGELGATLGAGAAASLTAANACSLDAVTVTDAALAHVQGFDDAAAAFPTCISNRRPGTDVLIVRHADPDSSDVETGGVLDLTKVKDGQIYLQTGLGPTGTLAYVMKAGDSGTNAANFVLTKKDKVTLATLRKMHVHIYYVSSCSVEVAGSCAGADGGTPIPTLKRVELTAAGGVTSTATFTIAEGIENLQLEYGTDSSGNDGAPDGYSNATLLVTGADWANVMSLRIFLVARSIEATPGFTDTKVYAINSASAASAAAGETGYRRHVFVQTVRLANPAGWRMK
jgi:type IV pilus assembly protein PilW